MQNKFYLILALAAMACGCTREVYLQQVPCTDCEPCEEEECQEPVQEVVEPAPAPVCQPTCVVPTCYVYPCAVSTCTPCATTYPVYQPTYQPVYQAVMPTYTVAPVVYY